MEKVLVPMEKKYREDESVSNTRRTDTPRRAKRKKSEKWIRHLLAWATDPLFGLGAHHHLSAFIRDGAFEHQDENDLSA
jgi:hypothetical protein